jgi:hypothetical protein
MMASTANVLLCAGLALVLYTCMGLPLAARFAPRPFAALLAPATGWAVHSAVALPPFFLVGLSRAKVVAVPQNLSLLNPSACDASLYIHGHGDRNHVHGATMPVICR